MEFRKEIEKNPKTESNDVGEEPAEYDGCSRTDDETWKATVKKDELEFPLATEKMYLEDMEKYKKSLEEEAEKIQAIKNERKRVCQFTNFLSLLCN